MLPAHPDRLQRQRRLHQLLDRATSSRKSEAIDGIKRNSLSPANGKTYTWRRRTTRRQPGIDPARRGDGKTYLGTTDGLESSPGRRQPSPRRAGIGRQGLHPRQGRRAVRPRQSAHELHGARPGDARSSRGDRRPSSCADAPLRPANDTFTEHRRRGLPATTARARSSAATGELEPGWKRTSASRTSQARPRTRSCATRSCACFVWTFAFAASTVFFSFAIGLFLAIALDKPGMRFRRSTGRCSSSPTRCPASSRCSCGPACSTTTSGSSTACFAHAHPVAVRPRTGPGLGDPVSVWLTVPYFFLVSLGALQSIPEELIEAARVDGGGRGRSSGA